MTNHEKLKQMTVEEFAEWLDEMQTDGLYGNGCDASEWRAWLLQAAE